MFYSILITESSVRPAGAGSVPQDRPNETGGRLPADRLRHGRRAHYRARRGQEETGEVDYPER